MGYDSLYSHGFARVAAAVPHLRPAEPAFNTERTLALAAQASEQHAALVVFPELGLSAYAIDDLLHQRAVTAAVLDGLGAIVDASRELLPVVLVGAPLWAGQGLFNCAVAIHRGRVLGVVPKSYLPDYHEYYEERQFRAAREAIGDTLDLLGERVPFGNDLIFSASDLPDFAIHAEICEDVWTPIPPSTYGAMAGATILANLSASNITIGKADFRRTLCMAQSARTFSRLHLHRRRPGRVDHRPRVGRAGADLRERRPGRRGGALQPRGGSALRRHRPRPDRLRPRRRPTASATRSATTASACGRSARSRSSSGRVPSACRCSREIERFPYVPGGPGDPLRALLRGLQHPGPRARDAACARPGSRRS